MNKIMRLNHVDLIYKEIENRWRDGAMDELYEKMKPIYFYKSKNAFKDTIVRYALDSVCDYFEEYKVYGPEE
jgi:hypothetical protein